MTYRARIALALAAAALVPLAILGFGVRQEMSSQLGAQATRRAEALVGVLRADLAQETASLHSRLRTHANRLAGDNRFRLGLGGAGDRRWLLDWTGESMAASGLSVLRVQDAAGRVLSSGHFRNEYDRLDPELPGALVSVGGTALVRFRAPDGEVVALAGVDSFKVGDRRFRIVGGVAFDVARALALLPAEELAVTLELGPAPQGDAAAEIELPSYDAVGGGGLSTARFLVAHNPSLRLAIRRSVDRRMILAAGLTLLLAGVLALWLGARISRPLAELAEKTSRLDLDRLDQDFASDRADEIGALGNLLAAMTQRLRASSVQLREAERRAATGDLARQINHDVKNGLAPIRHVLRHLAETATTSPERLAAVFAERRDTLDSSVTYLEGLARNYARLAPQVDKGPSDLRELFQDVARGSRTAGVDVEVQAAADVPPVRVDAVVLRRIVENLLSNAIDALEGRPGRVILASEMVRNSPQSVVRFAVSDTGRGMTREELDKAFNDFHTTKPSGTGLGLSVVRRLVGDLGGTLRVETMPGQGSTFIVEIPSV